MNENGKNVSYFLRLSLSLSLSIHLGKICIFLINLEFFVEISALTITVTHCK